MFTEEQDKIIHCDDRHFKVLSAAGSGKTTVLAARIAQLCANGASPEGILAITFTRRAGKELKARLSEQHKAATIGTFHSCILKVLQKLGHKLNVISEDEADAIIDKCATSVGLRVKGKYQKGSRKKLKKEIRDVRCGLIQPTALSQMYLSSLSRSGDLDFDGILVEGVKMAQSGDFDWVQHLFVDEAQDNEPLQWQFVMEIAKNASVMVVGDIGQSLYSFRGAEPELFSDLKWPELSMTQSFRFPCNIAEVSNKIGATPLTVTSVKAAVPINVFKNTNVTDLIKHIAKDRDLSDIAVLCRYNSDVEQIRGDLMQAGVSVVVPSITWRGPVHDLLACLAAPSSATARHKVVSTWMEPRPSILQYVASSLSQQSISAVIREWLSLEGQEIQDVLSALSISDAYKPEVVNILKEYGQLSLEEYIAETSEQEWIAEGYGVSVGTVHWSKGGEWPEVILPYMDRGNWPRRSSPEELRVLYVACTRTKENLHIIHGESPSEFVNFFL